MLTKAYVEEIVDNYRVKVRIPIFNGLDSSPNATPTEQLSISPICAIPGGKYNYSVGDIVFVTFEDNDLGRPVILGQLYADIDNQGLASLTLDSLEVKQSATLPSDTSIGNVSAESIKNLQGIRLPVQQQIDSLSGGVVGVAQNNPYMNTIVQNFMEAHYVILPNGNYIVDSFKVGEQDTGTQQDSKTPIYTPGDHYFYEFTKNTGTEGEEVPIYDQSKLLYKITLSNQWGRGSGQPLNGLDEETPVYVVFGKDENNNISSASLFVQVSGNTEDKSSGQMLFKQLEGTSVDVELVDVSEESIQNKALLHGDKYFWDLLLTNFVSSYYVVGVDENISPSSAKYGQSYYTQGHYFNTGEDLLKTTLIYPWVYYENDNTVGIVCSNLAFSDGDIVYIASSDGKFILDGDGNPVEFSVNGMVIDMETFPYVDLSDQDYQDWIEEHGKPMTVVVKQQDDYIVHTFVLNKITSDQFSDAILVDTAFSEKPSSDSECEEVTLADIINSLVIGQFQYLSSKFTVSNVLQFVGTVALSMSGVNVRELYGELKTPRKSLDLSNYHTYSETTYSGYTNTIDAVDKLYLQMFGENVVEPDGVVYCRDILMKDQFSAFGHSYRWDPTETGSYILTRLN